MDRSTVFSSITRPLVGVYLGSGSMTIGEVRRHVRIRKLVEANKQAGTTLAFFTSKDVDFSKEQFTGAYFDDKEQTWRKRSFPLPDVVYIRGGGAHGETADLIEKFDDLGIKSVNPIHAFNKGEVYQYLHKDQDVRSHLPPTVNVEKTDEIKNTILKYGKTYVKACRGRKGLQVMCVEKLPNNSGYLYSYSILGRLARRKTNNMESLLKSIRAFFGDKKVIVQRAIDLVKISNNRLVDFRAEVQRNKNDEIDIVGVCVRVGHPNSPITTHSYAYRYDDYLSKLFPRYTSKQIKSLKKNINDFLQKVYLGIEKTYGKFGEMGIDFGIDKKGKIWLIECNSQSAKVSIQKAYGDKARRVYLNPLEYAKRIAKSHRNRSYDQRSRGSRGNRSRYSHGYGY